VGVTDTKLGQEAAGRKGFDELENNVLVTERSEVSSQQDLTSMNLERFSLIYFPNTSTNGGLLKTFCRNGF